MTGDHPPRARDTFDQTTAPKRMHATHHPSSLPAHGAFPRETAQTRAHAPTLRASRRSCRRITPPHTHTHAHSPSLWSRLSRLAALSQPAGDRRLQPDVEQSFHPVPAPHPVTIARGHNPHRSTTQRTAAPQTPAQRSLEAPGTTHRSAHTARRAAPPHARCAHAPILLLLRRHPATAAASQRRAGGRPPPRSVALFSDPGPVQAPPRQ